MNAPVEEPKQKSNRVQVVIHSFFVVPFLIAAFAVLLFAMFRLVVGNPPTLEESLDTISRGSETERWQAAMDLAALLQDSDQTAISDAFIDRMTAEFARSESERTSYLRLYLAIAMGHTRDHRFEPVLLESVNDPDPVVRAAIIKALGLAGTQESSAALLNALEDESPNVALEAVIALGQVGGPDVVPVLKNEMNENAEPNIRWEAAIALLKQGDNAGVPVVARLLDRSYYEQFSEVTVEEQDHAIEVAIAVATQFPDVRFEENLVKLSQSDPNLRIANAALTALKDD